MEGGAIAQTALQNDVPFVVVRAISDLADESASASVEQMEQIAADRSAQILVELFKSEAIEMYEELKAQAGQAAQELLGAAGLKDGQILVVGCSSSEICGDKIGSHSSPEVAEAVFAGIWEAAKNGASFLRRSAASI